MSTNSGTGQTASSTGRTARRFVEARLADQPLDAFPGEIPPDLSTAYACQEAAIELWRDTIAGWKIGRISDDLAPRYGADRLAGPVFRKSVLTAAPEGATPFPVFTGGFAAVEAEYVLALGADAPAGKTDWSRDEARELVRDVMIGVELAGSPLAAINDLGPTVVIADFGNNDGLILGGRYPNWRDRPVEEWACETVIDGETVGTGVAGGLPGGPFEALRFLLALNARRGRPLRQGDLISSGAVTGVHDIKAGQTARISFGDAGAIECRAVRRA